MADLGGGRSSSGDSGVNDLPVLVGDSETPFGLLLGKRAGRDEVEAVGQLMRVGRFRTLFDGLDGQAISEVVEGGVKPTVVLSDLPRSEPGRCFCTEHMFESYRPARTDFKTIAYLADVGPETRYAKAGEVHIAYQTRGTSDRDLVCLAGIFSHVELQWENPRYAELLTRLSQFTRLITMDMRGTGLSDREGDLPLLEDQMDDVTAVLDRVGSNKVSLLGVSQAGPMAILYAASYPQRVDALILYAAYASSRRRDDYPWGRDDDWMEQYLSQLDHLWGQGTFLTQMAPSLQEDEEFKVWWGRMERFSSAPGNAVSYARAHTRDDVRDLLKSVRVPTLVLQRKDDTYRSAGQARYLAEHIPDAQLVELEGRDHLPYAGDHGAIADEIQEFLTGVRAAPQTARVLTTVLFTDIVDSTRRAAELGDARWNELLNEHNRLVRRQLAEHRGQLINTVGDGVFAMFDGPARAIRSAQAIRNEVGALGLSIRAGIHTGEVEVGPDDVAGLGVHIGARIGALALGDEVLVSRTVKDLVAGSGIEFEDRGVHELKGVPDSWQVFAVAG